MTVEVRLTFVLILSVYCHSEKRAKVCFKPCFMSNVKDLKDWMLFILTTEFEVLMLLALRLSSKAGGMYVCLHVFKCATLPYKHQICWCVWCTLFYLGTSHKKSSTVMALKRSQPVWIRTGKALCSTVTLNRKQVLETLPWSRRITLLNGESHYGGEKRGLV